MPGKRVSIHEHRNTGRLRWAAAAAAAVLACAVTHTVGGAGVAGPKKVTILYTSGADGQIRSCNCSKFRYGGYGREITAVEGIRKQSPNVVLIEGGDFVAKSKLEQNRAKADVAIKSMAMLGLAAAVPGEAEISFGWKSLSAIQGFNGLPVVLANVSDSATGKPVAPKPYVVYKTAGGVRAAVVGLLGKRVMLDAPTPDLRLDIADPAAALTRIAPSARKGADLLIVAAHTSPEEAKAVARTGKADIVICTHTPGNRRVPETGKNTLDAAYERIGKCIYLESGTCSGRSIGRLDIEIGKAEIKAAAHKLLFLDRNYEESPKTAGLYEAYNKRVREIALRETKDLHDQFEKLLKERGYDFSRRNLMTYSGDASCKQCHEEIHASWSKTRHAHAFATLEKRKQEFDPECVACHVTGSGVRGGFVDAKTTPTLVNVQCEVCHGPAPSHVKNPSAPYGAVEEDNCRRCHTDEVNPDFDYEPMWKKVKH